MFALRTSTSLSALGLVIGVAATSWLTALTYERAPATRRLAQVVMPAPTPDITPPERLRTRAVVDLAVQRPVVRKPVASAAPAPVEPLVPVYMPSPRYPMEALRARRQGQVVLNVTVTPQGDVTDVSVARTSGDSQLDGAAEEAVRGWRFAAADARPARYTAEMPVRFELTDPY